MAEKRLPGDETEIGTHEDGAQSFRNLFVIIRTLNAHILTGWPRRRIASTAFADIRITQQHRRSAAIASAIVLNSLFVWIAASSLRFPVAAGATEIHLTLTPFTHAEVASLPRAPAPTLPVVELPEISIRTEAPTSAPAAASASIVLAPRPDPDHPNPLPATAEIGAGGVAAIAMILKILVLPDGSVTDAVVVKSSGKQETDMAAIAFVKLKWRFLPALIGGTAIQYWTTVSFRTV